MTLFLPTRREPFWKVHKNFIESKAEPKSGRCTRRRLILSQSLILLISLVIASSFILLISTRSAFETSSARSNETNGISINKRQRLAGCSTIPENERFDCHPEDGASELSCTDRGCCWSPTKRRYSQRLRKLPLDVPYCYYPQDWSIYKAANKTPNNPMFYENCGKSFYKKDIRLIRMDVYYIEGSIIRVKIVDALDKRYEPHIPIERESLPGNTANLKYSIEKSSRAPGFSIKSTSDDTVLLDSSIGGGFIFADQFLQISFRLNEGSVVYGLGEHRNRLRLSTKWQSQTFFNKDQPPTENANLYGSHPFALVMAKPGQYFGLLFLNSNAMDVILQPTPAITYRSIGGIFDFYSFMGPSPSQVIEQYSRVIGKPFMPPYWSLGFHLCRFGYGTLDETIRVWNRTRAAGIPFDTQWNDLDYMKENNDFTYNTDKFGKLPEFVEHLHEIGMHYVPLIDAAISGSEANGSYRPYDEGIRRDIFIKEANSTLPFKGKVWNTRSSVWPDFTNPAALDYWHDMMNDMWRMFPYDGAWIDMNEPSNFYNGKINGCENNDRDNPIYVPRVVGDVLATKTLCMNAQHYLGSHYNIHNTYGTSEAVATNRALTKIRGLRPFVISRSTWVGHGFYAGHWSGDIYSSWHDMKMSVAQLLNFGFFQIPMMGADICGFDGNTTEALCNRWSQLGAFYPFSRNHNSDDTIEQDPVAMGQLVVESTRKALTVRYRLLPHLYTLFFRAHAFGETVARPLFFEFSNDSATWDLDTQFLWGNSLMIVPVLEEGATRVTAYVPKGTWYDFYEKKRILSRGENYTLEAPLDTIPLLVRGGYILPAQTPSKTTTESRENPFELLIASDDLGLAEGELYWDDGDSLDATEKKNYRWLRFNLVNRTVSCIQAKPGKYAGKMTLGKVEVLGVVEPVTEVFVNDKKTRFIYDEARSYLTVQDLEVDLAHKMRLSWI
ncbi:lysosomal alpha-glucosidase-like isoform X2 [Venturia canescens]|nr:lysosomal alpha-glucosidase-like isoform X2 [Venturia canescens]